MRGEGINVTLVGASWSANTIAGSKDPQAGSSVMLNFTTSTRRSPDQELEVTITEDEEVITDLSKDDVIDKEVITDLLKNEVIDKEDEEVISKDKAAVSEDESVTDSISGVVEIFFTKDGSSKRTIMIPTATAIKKQFTNGNR